jgi:hypothetical protein
MNHIIALFFESSGRIVTAGLKNDAQARPKFIFGNKRASTGKKMARAVKEFCFFCVL